MPVDLLSGRFAETPLYVDSAGGAWLETESGAMLDYLLGNCTQLLGHCHPTVVDAVTAQASTATNVGDLRTRISEQLAERVLRIAGKDALRFVNSGSEAVHCALRVARGYTERSLIVRFDGHYHGWFDEEIARFVPVLEYRGGLLPTAGDEQAVLPWNDRDALEALMTAAGERVAAIVCEPLLCHAGPVPAEPGFLELLRELSDRHGALLVFDECVTGFRVALGGAQEHYGVEADLVVYSKALSAGYPLGVCAGRAEVMALFEDGRVYQAATYDANPISMAAANATLDVLEAGGVYERIAAHGRGVQQLVTGALGEAGVPVVCQGEPAVFQFLLTDAPVTDHAAALRTDVALYGLLVEELLLRGVHVGRGDLRADPDASWLASWFVSAAHGERELEWLDGAVRPALNAALARRADRQAA